MTVPLDMTNHIRSMDAGGVPRAEIARRPGISRNTVAKYADMEEMSPAAPSGAPRVTVLDNATERASADAKPSSKRGCFRSSEDISASRRGSATRAPERGGLVGERCGVPAARATRQPRPRGRAHRSRETASHPRAWLPVAESRQYAPALPGVR